MEEIAPHREKAAEAGPEADAMGVFAAMRKRRMHRQFTDEPVDRATLDRLIYAATRAAVARPDLRHVLTVTDPRLIRTVQQACPGFIADPPAIIVVCTDVAKSHQLLGDNGPDDIGRLDSGAAAAFLTLAAPALGLGVTIAKSYTPEVVQTIFGLPEEIRPDVLVGVGHPVADPWPAPRRFHSVLHQDRYGTAWEGSE
jgi:nitroreductase